jgi:peptidoglycan hydrolase-like protein with peptidoglycan-binding domain
MDKKVIRLTENDVINLVKRVISEQSEERKIVMGIQKFLNQRINAGLVVDGKTGRNSKTSEAIKKYQSMIGVYPVDGVWGPDTWDKMPEKDRKLLNDYVAKEGGIVDRLYNFIFGE